MSLAEAVEKAASHLESGGVEGEPLVEEIPVEGEETQEGEETSEEKEESQKDDELDEAGLAEAKRLYKALQNPQTANQVVAAMAAQLGFLGPKAPETLKEEAKAKKEITAILKEGLGEEYSFLADRLGKSIDAIFQQEKEEQAVKEQANLQKQVEKESLNALDKLASKTKGESRKVEAKMAELSAKILPGPGMSADEYMEVLYTQATAGRTVQRVKANLNDKIRRNANDVSTRLRSAGGNRDEGVGFDPNKKYSLKESVQLAAKQMELNSKRK